MRNVLLNKDKKIDDFYMYVMPSIESLLELRNGYNPGEDFHSEATSGTVILYKIFMPCLGAIVNYSDKHHKQLLSNIYSTSQEGFILIELINNYDKWKLSAEKLYARNLPSEEAEDTDGMVIGTEDIENNPEKDTKQTTSRGTLYTNSRFCSFMDGWSEGGIKNTMIYAIKQNLTEYLKRGKI